MASPGDLGINPSQLPTGGGLTEEQEEEAQLEHITGPDAPAPVADSSGGSGVGIPTQPTPAPPAGPAPTPTPPSGVGLP